MSGTSAGGYPSQSEEEAVKELMRLVRVVMSKHSDHAHVAHAERWNLPAAEEALHGALDAVEQHARQMLRSAQEDARDAAR